jgi:hypothetical protein
VFLVVLRICYDDAGVLYALIVAFIYVYLCLPVFSGGLAGLILICCSKLAFA